MNKTILFVLNVLFIVVILTQYSIDKKSTGSESKIKTKPNVVLIAIDDLNDCIGCLSGHPQAKTLPIDKWASEGVLFSYAQCQHPVCNPFIAGMMSSLQPSMPGIYFLELDLAESEVARYGTSMPQRFQNEGIT